MKKLTKKQRQLLSQYRKAQEKHGKALRAHIETMHEADALKAKVYADPDLRQLFPSDEEMEYRRLSGRFDALRPATV